MSSLHAGVILFHDQHLAVHDDLTLPLAPVPPRGNPAEAAREAARSALGVDVRVDASPCLEVRATAGTELYFRAAAPLPPTPAPPRLLTRQEALHLPLAPWTAWEAILRSWDGPPWWRGRLVLEEPVGRPPKRTRAGAVIIRDGHMLLIRYRHRRGDYYEIPGGGVEPGETPQAAVVRELAEETGLTGTVGREIARVDRVHRGSHPGHYFLVEASGTIGPRSSLDLEKGAAPVWVPVADLRHLPLWPKRLGWRIAHWHDTGWPQRPAEFCDSLLDLEVPCDW
ncbi:NUDIX hydrolase [Streptomyces sp. NPDC046977]|uniref:NUDIX hydrolase n=1 Tax=Streptomyces sp. NPDC046977 TaxID=3154703 RepID=UPI0033E53ED5